MNWVSIENRGKIDEQSTMAYLKRQRRILTHHLPVPLPSLLLLLCHSLSSLLFSSPLLSSPPFSRLPSPYVCERIAMATTPRAAWVEIGGLQRWLQTNKLSCSDFHWKPEAEKPSACACLCLFMIVYTPLFPVLMHAMSKGEKKSTNATKMCWISLKSNPVDRIFTLCQETSFCVGSVIPD